MPSQRLVSVVSSGKSVFLLRMLIRRLALKLPTALQIGPNRGMLFHEGCVKEFKLLDDDTAYEKLWGDKDPLSRIWALVESNKNLREPAPIFQQGPFFAVQAASPRPERRKWTKTVRTKRFYMKPWPFLEVVQA